MGFVSPEILLLLIPLLIWVYWRLKRKRSAISLPSLAAFDLPKGKQRNFDRWRIFLRAICMALLILASARPHAGFELISEKKEALDIMLVVDTSVSMRAMDFVLDSERRDRLAVLKSVLSNFISERPNDRIGLVVFGSEAFTQSPLTNDHLALATYLNRIQVGMAGDATAIGDGLAIAVKRLESIEASSKIVVLLTDGENNAGSLDPRAIAQAAKSLGVKIYTIGVGTNEPVPFPRESFFGTSYEKRIFKLDEALLKEVAATTGAAYFLASDTERLRKITQEINALEPTKRDDKPLRVYDEKAGLLLFMAFCVFMGEMLLVRWRLLP